MLNELLSKPIAIIAVAQPLLLVWVAAISFFVTLAVVAIFSPQRKWYELVCMFAAIFGMLSLAGFVGVSYFADITMVTIEIIELEQAPRSLL